MKRIIETTFRIAALLALGGSLLACATPAPKGPGTLEQIREAVAEGVEGPKTPPPQPPREVAAALLPPININVPGNDGTREERRFDVRVRRVPARDFFLGLVEGTPYNMMVHPDIKGRITLDLKNVTLPEVMDMVRRVYGYEYERTAAGFQVLPSVLRTRIFPVDYLDVKRSGTSEMSAGSGEVSSAGNKGNDSGNPTQGSFVNTRSESDFWQSLETSLKQIVGKGEGRTVSVNPQSGVVMVRAMPGELRDVEAFLQTTRQVVERQVILEARILEVELADGFQAGINWAALAERGTDSLVAGQVGGGSIFSGQGVSSLSGETGVLDPAAPVPVAGTATSAFGGVFTLAVNSGNFTAFIELLKTQGNVQVLSSPRVATVNNQKAVIKVGSDEFFVTDVQTETTTTATTTLPNISVELTPFFSGVALDVTPQISAEGNIILHIHPSVSEVSEQVKNINVTSGSLTIPLAASTIRESDSIVRAANGQVVVIGGLMQNRTRDERASVPLLGDIPLLGALFRHTRQAKLKSELVILLKPVVVDSQQRWKEQLQRSDAAFRAMDQGQP